MISKSLIAEIAKEEGLDLLSSVSVETVSKETEVEKRRLKIWQDSGYAAEMQYMKREASLFVELEKFLPGVKSVLSFCINYFDGKERPPLQPGHGKVARYAWGQDYHQVIPRKLESIVKNLKSRVPVGFKHRIFTDAVPLLERSLARTGELGFIGKNSLLIRPGIGSFTFLGEILLDQEIEESGGNSKGGGCKSCMCCAVECPTGAIVGAREIDASKCISYLTIEKRSDFSEWEEHAIGDWLFGCDVCQEVCPFNHEGVDTDSSLKEFIDGERQSLSLLEILSIREDKEYKERFKGSPILRAKREQLLRNACAVAANTKNYGLLKILKEVTTSDSSEMVRNSAARSVRRLIAD